MVSRPLVMRWLIAAGLIAAVVFSVLAAQDHLWANLALGVMAAAGCVFVLTRREAIILPDPAVSPVMTIAPRDALATLLDQVSLPLLRYSPKLGLQAVNRAARALFSSDDLISEPPELLDAIISSDARAPCL
ncbi:MAG: hypothetical protein JF615_03140, partial [Asticcacaulis sp.]|nr:hypothetical protein [Asticcacaulis sp.]